MLRQLKNWLSSKGNVINEARPVQETILSKQRLVCKTSEKYDNWVKKGGTTKV